MMAGRDLNSGALTVVAGDMAAAFFVELLLDTPLYFCTASDPIEYGGQIYLGIPAMTVGQVNEEAGEIQQLQIGLPAVPNEYLSLALGTPTRGKVINLCLGILNPATHAIEQMLPLWSGRVDTMPITYGPEQAQISLTAEHRAISFSKAKPLRYTDADQRRLYPGDACLEYLIPQSQAQDVWPSREWFKQ